MSDEVAQAVTTVCRLCDSQMWELAWIMFDEHGEISAYPTKMKCHVCGIEAETPMPGVNIG